MIRMNARDKDMSVSSSSTNCGWLVIAFPDCIQYIHNIMSCRVGKRAPRFSLTNRSLSPACPPRFVLNQIGRFSLTNRSLSPACPPRFVLNQIGKCYIIFYNELIANNLQISFAIILRAGTTFQTPVFWKNSVFSINKKS